MGGNLRRNGVIIWSAAAAVFGLLSAAPALADSITPDSCHAHNTDSSIICTGGTKWCGATCQSTPVPTGTQDVNCSSCTTICARSIWWMPTPSRSCVRYTLWINPLTPTAYAAAWTPLLSRLLQPQAPGSPLG